MPNPNALEQQSPAGAASAHLPEQLLKFADLQAMKIISTRNMLNRKIEREAFPPGRWIGENSRAWLLSEVLQWLKDRPTTRSDTLAIRKSKQRVRRERRERAAASKSLTSVSA